MRPRYVYSIDYTMPPILLEPFSRLGDIITQFQVICPRLKRIDLFCFYPTGLLLLLLGVRVGAVAVSVVAAIAGNGDGDGGDGVCVFVGCLRLRLCCRRRS